MEHLGRVRGATLGFFDHLLGDRQVAGSDVGHVAGAAAKTGVDLLADHAVATAPPPEAEGLFAEVTKGAGPRVGHAIGAARQVLAAIDPFVGMDNPMKVATALSAEADPAGQVGRALSGGVDAAAVVAQAATGDRVASYRGAETVQEEAAGGTYGSIAQGLTLWGGVATGDAEVQDLALDDAARTGGRGFLLAWGNAAADAALDAELVPGQPQGGLDGGYMTDFDSAAERARAMRWYEPWTW